jgi:hypothetical protein
MERGEVVEWEALSCHATDISVSPRNNGAALPTPLRRQRGWVRGESTRFWENKFTLNQLNTYKHYSTFPKLLHKFPHDVNHAHIPNIRQYKHI